MLEFRDLVKNPATQQVWTTSLANEFGRLAQGIRNIKGSDCIRFVYKHQIPKGRNITFTRLVVDERPGKSDPNRTRITVMGNCLTFDGELYTETTDIMGTKMLLNSVLSTKGAKFMTIDIKNFYLGTPMAIFEYMKVKLDTIPQEIIDKYDLKDKESNGYIYMEIRKGMYGLKQAGVLANQHLEKKLEQDGYIKTTHTPGLWKHKSRPIIFNLCVDDFGVKYVGQEHAEHLIASLRKHYEDLTINWEGDKYCGMNIEWDYDNRTCDIAVHGYVTKQLNKLLHISNKKRHSPTKFTPPIYGQKVQMAKEIPEYNMLTPEEIKKLQQAIGAFLWYGRITDSTMLHALSTLASAQSKGTEATKEAMHYFLDYCATHPNATIRFHASDMILKIHSDASYLSEPEAKSRAGGYFYLGNKDNSMQNNGAIHILAKLIKNVVSSAAEAEIAAIFMNAKEAVPIRTTLVEMNHPQPETEIITDNLAAQGILNKSCKQTRSKAIDMNYY